MVTHSVLESARKRTPSHQELTVIVQHLELEPPTERFELSNR